MPAAKMRCKAVLLRLELVAVWNSSLSEPPLQKSSEIVSAGAGFAQRKPFLKNNRPAGERQKNQQQHHGFDDNARVEHELQQIKIVCH
jgi:hypothetical protein